jgi:hypothetical protein
VDVELHRLAELLRLRDDVDARVAHLTGRSARQGDVGEFIASKIFDIDLATIATQAGYDGRFHSGALAGRTVNIKTYGDAIGGLDVGQHPCDFYLVLSGPPRPAASVRHHRWRISAVYLFDTQRLMGDLVARNVKIGTATSLRRSDLAAAELSPAVSAATPIILTEQQRDLLSLFS